MATHLVAMGVLIVALLPLYVAAVTSLHAEGAAPFGTLQIPSEPTLENYARIWTSLQFDRLFINSSILSIVSAAIAALLSAAIGFYVSRGSKRLRRHVRTGLIALMAVPPIIVVLPVFLFYVDVGINNTMLGAVIAEVGILLPFGSLMMTAFMLRLPIEPFEAAVVDGATPWRQFWSVALPLARAPFVALLIICLIYVWNDLLVPLILLQTQDQQVLAVGVASLGPGRTGVRDGTLLLTAVMISTVPLIVLFFAARKQLVRGLTEGSAD